MTLKCVLTCTAAIAMSATAVLGQAPTPAPEPAPAPAAAPVWSVGGINFSGLIDTYYNYAPNHPASGNNAIRNFVVKPNQFSLNMVKLTLDHDPDPVGFKLDLGFGRAWEVFHATEPAKDGTKYIPQAYLSFKPKSMGGLQIDVGKFFTSAGAELTETHLNWNYGRALIYANGPYYHFGMRVNKPVNQHFAVGFQVINGCNNLQDNNSGKTIGLTSALTTKKFNWYNNYYFGPEKDATNKGVRNFYDTVINLNPNDKANFYVNFDYGSDKKITTGSNTWVTIGFAAKFQTSAKTYIAPRYEYYSDRDGFITGTSQKLQEFTLTYEYKWLEGLLTRLEYRRDWSDKPFFDRGNQLANAKSQNTVLIGFVAYFGPKR